jgi:hypothetical protein
LIIPAGMALKIFQFQTASGHLSAAAERLWPLVDESLVNKHFETIDGLGAAIAPRCCMLQPAHSTVKNHTNFHWRPKKINPSQLPGNRMIMKLTCRSRSMKLRWPIPADIPSRAKTVLPSTETPR